MNELATQFSDPDQGYTDSQAAFLNGDLAVLHNGTWVVDQYSREAPFEYMATSLPTIYGQPGAWGDSHMWVLPAASNEDPATRAASLEFVKFLYDNIDAWARGTGHLANRTSILETMRRSGTTTPTPQRSRCSFPRSRTGPAHGMRSPRSSMRPGSQTRIRPPHSRTLKPA